MLDEFVGKGRKNDQKLKPFLVYQYLLKHSDEDHAVSASEIVGYLQEVGISAERRSIYKDIQEINRAVYLWENDSTIDEADEVLAEDSEMAVVVYDPSLKGFYVRQRRYNLEDIRLIAESVYAAKFIDEKRAKNMIDVLGDFVSEAQSEKIKHDAFLMDRTRTANTSTFYIVNTINDAMKLMIDGRRHIPEKISFKYLKYTIQDVKQQVEKRGGERYVVSPFKLLINDGNYYLIAFDDQSKQLRTYRVDRMKGVKATGEPREGEEVFAKIDLTNYAQRVFSMFSGEKEHVTIQFINPLLDTVIERFGVKESIYKKTDEKHFSVTTQIEVSNQFFRWLCGFGNKAKILEPQSVKEKFSAYVGKIYGLYSK